MKISRAKGARSDSTVKGVAKRTTLPSGANRKSLKRVGGAEAGRSHIAQKALESVEKPKRKRESKSVKKADNMAEFIVANDKPTPSKMTEMKDYKVGQPLPKPKPKGLNMHVPVKVSAGVRPRERRYDVAPAPPDTPPPEAPPTAINSYNSFQRANKGKGYNPKQMGEAWRAYKATK